MRLGLVSFGIGIFVMADVTQLARVRIEVRYVGSSPIARLKEYTRKPLAEMLEVFCFCQAGESHGHNPPNPEQKIYFFL